MRLASRFFWIERVLIFAKLAFMKIFLRLLFCILFSAIFFGCQTEHKKTIIFAYGNSIHYWGDHENKLMSEMLAELINKNTQVSAFALDANSPNFEAEISKADALMIISEGETNHPLMGKMEILKKFSDSGKGVGFIHYALDFGSDKESKILNDIIGGNFEQHWSVNPMFEADFKDFAKHPITQGLKPFKMNDEFYFNMRFAEDEKNITHLLATIPPDAVRKKSAGSHSGNKFVRENLGRQETIAWAYQKENNARGFGFTGAHSVFTLYNGNVRKLLLNASLWLAKENPPANGIESQMPPLEEFSKKIQKDKRPDYDNYIKKAKLFLE